MRRSNPPIGGLCCAMTVIVMACSGSSPNGLAGPGGPDASADALANATRDASDATLPDTAAETSGDAPRTDVPDASAEGATDAGPFAAQQPLSPYLVVDQFGYRTSAEKIAVLRSPKVGADSTTSFSPGPTYALVDTHSGQKLLEAAPALWNGGATDLSSGDAASSFDFSSVTTPGDYFVLDEMRNVRSPVFRIADDVYRDVLTQAARVFYYQRDGIAKDAKYAGANWADGAEHPQDATCGLYSDGSVPKDLHGGWFDAGDQSKYAGPTASNVIELLRAYTEKPAAFGDAAGIPESGNGVPDILDEVKWATDWLGRMQNGDGSVLSIVAHTGGSPPSADTAPCKYGPASTSATLSSAAALAYASIVFKSVSATSTAYPGYAGTLATWAASAWTWAAANPAVTFFNLTNGLGAREQEVDAAGRLSKQVQAAAFLFELTGTATYQSVVDSSYAQLQTPLDPSDMEPAETLLEYSRTPMATLGVVQNITSAFRSAVEGAAVDAGTSGGFFGAQQTSADPYLANLPSYPWGSNAAKAGQGTLFYDLVAVDAPASATASRYAERYVHYVHGVNPLALVYLSNMGSHGAQASVTRIFSSWFAHGSKWDAVGASTYGPPPGFLVAGPNPSYTWDVCCPSGCGSPANNALCGAAPLVPPAAQPNQKSYRDFNDGWPLDSWLVAEPNDAYQAKYVRLLSKFVQ
jgi:endoglucanase